jgi:hypothetical protein
VIQRAHTAVFKPDGAFWGQEVPIYSVLAELTMKYISDLKKKMQVPEFLFMIRLGDK